LTENSTFELPALRRSTGKHDLQRKRKGPLFREEKLSRIHSGDGSCHQSQTERKRSAAHLQIWPRSEENLQATRQGTAASWQHPTLQPKL
jgi:hypothetical protein